MSKESVRLNIPNFISFLRILSIPITVWLILDGAMLAAFWVFVLAGISDAADGYIAKRYNLQTAVGGFLDPIADKALLVSVFVSLGHAGFIDTWLVILVVFRDALIIMGVLLYNLVYQNLTMSPLWISKVNTTVQIVLAAGILGMEGFGVQNGLIVTTLAYIVAVTTIWSGASYVLLWGRRAGALEPGE